MLIVAGLVGCEEGQLPQNYSIPGDVVKNSMPDTLGPSEVDKVMSGDIGGAIDESVSPVDPKCKPSSDQPGVTRPWTAEELERIRQAEEEKERLEAGLAADDAFEVDDDFFKQLIKAPPKQCGYKLSRFSRPQVQAICDAMTAVIEDRPVQCHVSNCTTASFLGVLKLLKTRKDFPQMKDQFMCRSPFPKAYLTYATKNIRGFVQEYGLGETRRMRLTGGLESRSNQLKQNIEAGFPKKGYPLLLQRDQSRSNSAHSVIFSHFQTADGKPYVKGQPGTIAKVCYWSSNQSTRGSGNRCETISYMQFIDTARITDKIVNDGNSDPNQES